MTVRNQDQIDLQTGLDLGDVRTFLVEQEGGHINRHLRVHGCGVFFHGLFLQQTQNLQRAGLGIANHACAVTARASDVGAFVQGRAQTLA